MPAVDIIRVLVNQRLTAAAEEICGLFERTIAEYEEELYRSNQEKERQRKLLDAVLSPEVRLNRAVISADVQQGSEPPPIKEEQEQLWTSKEGDQHQGLEEDDTTEVPSTADPLKSEDVEGKAQSSQTEENREADPPVSSSDQQVETEGDGEHCGGSEPAQNLDLDGYLQPVNDDETPDSSEEACDDDGKRGREPQSDLNTVALKLTQTAVSVSQPANDDRMSDSSEPETENSNDECKETRETLKNNGAPERITRKKPLSCSRCGKTFDSKERVQSHMGGARGEEKLVCSGCVQRSKQTAHLIALKRTRSGERTFICLICKKHFNYKADVVRHIRIHTGERPYGCSVCGQRFTQSTGLSIHMRTHTGERPFSCTFCPKRFIQSGILARHMRVHTGEKPYSCSVCDASFTLSQSLLKHMKIHTGEKPYSCSVCRKAFTQKGHLTQHMTLHTGDRAFSCHVCGRNFSRQSRVKKHKCVSESSK